MSKLNKAQVIERMKSGQVLLHVIDFHSETFYISLNGVKERVYANTGNAVLKTKGVVYSRQAGRYTEYKWEAGNAPVQPESPSVASKATYYTVVEHIETTYKTDDYSGKRYPTDYSVFTVINGNSNQVVEAFSAKEYGLDNAEYNANELRDKLNKALPKPRQGFSEEEKTALRRPLAELEALRTQVAKLTGELNVMEVDRDSWKDSCIMANQRIDIESRQYQELHQAKETITKLEADLAAAQAIIVQAGAMVEKKSRNLLDAIEANVQLKRVMDEIYVLSLDEIFEDTEASEKYLNNQLDKINRIALDCRSKSASEESSDAAQAVTLDNIQVLWLADHIKGDNVFETWMKSEECYKLLDAKIITEVIPKVKAPYWIFRIVAEYDTEANRQAIEARRTTLAQS